MTKNSRRTFLSSTGKLAVVSGLTTFAVNCTPAMKSENIFVHHVYFWLKNPDSREDLAKLHEGLKKLSKIKNLKMSHIGKPAETNREVIENSYTVSWLTIFDSKEEEEKYQVDPIHLEFVETCSNLWSKVVVYDSVDLG